eukprot:c21281_g1_i1 orf=560-1444(-)
MGGDILEDSVFWSAGGALDDESDRVMRYAGKHGAWHNPNSEICAATSVRFAEARPATVAEEAWLRCEDRLFHQEEEWLTRQAEDLLLRGSSALNRSSVVEEEAEDFNRELELVRWMQVQQEICAAQEAEHFCSLEEQIVRELQELANAENVERHLMMTALQRGAEYITDEELALKADHQELVSVRISAQKLLQLIDRAIYAKLEGERTRALQQVILAVRQQREIQHAAETQNIQLEFEIAKLKRERGDLSEKLEHEKDRTTCRICFVRCTLIIVAFAFINTRKHATFALHAEVR